MNRLIPYISRHKQKRSKGSMKILNTCFCLLLKAVISMVTLLVLTVPRTGIAEEVSPKAEGNRMLLTDQAVAYQIDPSHSGFVRTELQPPPLRKRWEVNLGGPISYPLIADGKVFVTVADTSESGTKLYALDSMTGDSVWGPISISSFFSWSNAAYDNGRIFVVNFDGLLSAYDAESGTLMWSRQLPDQYSFTSPTVAVRGIVYTGGSGSGGTVYAVNAFNGAILWTAPVENGDHSSPAVSYDGIYVSYACVQTYKFDPFTGALLWHYDTDCAGGGGRTPVYYRGRLYVRDGVTTPGGYVLDSNTGNLLTSYNADGTDPTPAFAGNLGFFLTAGTLEGRNLRNGRIMWSFAGDGHLSSAPIIVNRYIYIGSSTGNLYALDAMSGKQVWSTNVGAEIPHPDEHNVVPLTGLGAGRVS